MESSDASDLHQTDVVAIAIIIAIFFHRTADAHQNRGPRDRAIVTIRSPEALSDGYEDTWKNSTIAVRLNRDRGAIKPRSWSLRYGITSIDQDDDRRRPRVMINPRSWRKTWSFLGYFEAKSTRISSRSGSHDAAPRNFSHDFAKPPPRPLQLAMIFGSISSLKPMCFSL